MFTYTGAVGLGTHRRWGTQEGRGGEHGERDGVCVCVCVGEGFVLGLDSRFNYMSLVKYALMVM